MRVLLDESLPKRLKVDVKGFQVKTVPEMGWQGKKNGELLSLMQDKFNVFVTSDQNLQYQINLRNTTIPIIVLKASSNRYQDLKPLTIKLIKILKSPSPNRITIIS